MNKFKLLKGACLVAVTSMLPLSQVAMAEVTVSGWVNEGMQFWDDGTSSEATQLPDNGNTLGSRITFSGSNEVATGITAGFEVIIEPNITGGSLAFSNNGEAFSDLNTHTGATTLLSSNLHVAGAWGKITMGLLSAPTDNIAVLEDPSLTLWSSISPVFHGNGFTIQESSVAKSLGGALTWGNFLQCFTAPGLRSFVGIGIDCNGVYRNGIRYDLPAFGPVTVAIGYSNDDIYDISAKWKGDLGRIKGQIALGYAINQGVRGAFGKATSGAAAVTSGLLFTANGDAITTYDEAENFQVQAGLMDPVTGLFGSIAYQNEDADLVPGMQAGMVAVQAAGAGYQGGVISDDSDAWWLKVGIKKQWFSVGDTSLAFQYGQYEDQYGMTSAQAGVTGSEVERIGFSVDQYFGSNLIIYGSWEQLDLDVDQAAAGVATFVAAGFTAFGATAEELDTFTLGAVYFF